MRTVGADRLPRSSNTLLNKRIAIYIPSLHGGGAERVMVILANGFAARGVSVDLVLASADGSYLDQVHDVVRIIDLRATRVLKSLPGLISYLRRERPSALLSAINHANVIAIVAHRLARSAARLVVSERAQLSSALANACTLRGRLISHFMRFTYPLADSVVAVSDGVANDLSDTIGLARERIEVIYNPVVDENLLEMSNQPVRHPFYEERAQPVFLGVGRLVPVKGFVTLIRAFAKLRELRKARLIILGEGEQRTELQALINALGLENDISLPGFMDNPFPWMRRASVFVLSSVSEGLPGALIQAMACGVPVVATNSPGGTAEILEGGRWGRLVPVGDVEALSAAMLATLEEPSRLDIALRAKEFGVEQAVDGYMNAMKVDVSQ